MQKVNGVWWVKCDPLIYFLKKIKEQSMIERLRFFHIYEKKKRIIHVSTLSMNHDSVSGMSECEPFLCTSALISKTEF